MSLQLPAVGKQEGDEAGGCIAYRHRLVGAARVPQLAPKVSSDFGRLYPANPPGCALGIVSKALGKWVTLESAGNCSSQGC